MAVDQSPTRTVMLHSKDEKNVCFSFTFFFVQIVGRHTSIYKELLVNSSRRQGKIKKSDYCVILHMRCVGDTKHKGTKLRNVTLSS